MSSLLDWVVVVVLFAGVGLVAFRYYKRQAQKFGDGRRNQDMDKFRGGKGGCH